MNQSGIRSRWAAVGAAVAITLGAGGIGLVSATSPSGATAFSPIDPCRVADTRAIPEFNVGPRNTPIGAKETHVITAHGDNGECTGIPTSATGLQLNVTSLNATAPTFLAVWGSGSQPNVSNLNPQPGQPPIPNAVTTGLTGAGQFSVYNEAGAVDIIVDIVGFYSDHHHDDRYYTEGEVDTALAAKANVADTVRNPVAVETSTSLLFNVAVDTWQPVISTTITVPAGYTAIIEAEFGAESSCYGAVDDWCSIRILADGTDMNPAEGTSNAFDSTDSGTADISDYEETSITRTITLGEGTYTIAVESLSPNGVSMRLDDIILFVEGHLIAV